jgi:hypothetical protein
VRSAAQPYHTRSKGAPPHRSQWTFFFGIFADLEIPILE